MTTLSTGQMAYSPEAVCAAQHPAIDAALINRVWLAIIRCLYWICGDMSLVESLFVRRTIESSK